MIDAETEAEILRLFHTEGWPIGTIARQLKRHRTAIERVVRSPHESRPTPVRPTLIDAHRPFILDALQRWPELTARRLYDMCIDRGYKGSPSHFRDIVRQIRPKPARKPEAFLRLTVTPAEQGQVDWGHFGHVSIGRARRQLLAFVLVLSWSRMIFVRFFVGGPMPSFLKGHVEAFAFFEGVPRTLLYDNLKSAVLERHGDAIRFHPTLLELAKHYRFKPHPVGIRRGNEKGRVERAIRFLRDSFFAGRQWTDVADLNRQAMEWTLTRAADRPWPDDTRRTVRDVFEEEKPKLLQLPGDAFPTEFIDSVKIPKTPYARFEGNDYTVPPEFVKRTLTIAVSETGVRFLDGTDVVAAHERCYDKGQQIENEAHLAELRAEKRKAKHSRPTHRLQRAAPSAARLLELAGERGENLGAVTAHLLRLLDSYGGERLDGSIKTALERGTPHPRSVQMILEAADQLSNEPPRVDVDLPDDPRVRELAVRPHDLAAYDALRPTGDIDDTDDASAQEASDGE